VRGCHGVDERFSDIVEENGFRGGTVRVQENEVKMLEGDVFSLLGVAGGSSWVLAVKLFCWSKMYVFHSEC